MFTQLLWDAVARWAAGVTLVGGCSPRTPHERPVLRCCVKLLFDSLTLTNAVGVCEQS